MTVDGRLRRYRCRCPVNCHLSTVNYIVSIMHESTIITPALDFQQAALRLKKVVNHTPLTYNNNLSRKYQCHVWLKREDLQGVRSYKLRGAYNMMSSLPQ